MTAPIVVGYTATDAGADALVVGDRLAAASGADLRIVMVLPAPDRSVITPPDAGYDRHVGDVAHRWLAEAEGALLRRGGSTDAPARRSAVRTAESFAEGLVEEADDTDAACVVVGAATGGLGGRHRLGTVATELLHSADRPVLLAPAGARDQDVAGVGRVTVAIGTRPGADALLDEAVRLATATRAPLRLVSLVAVDLPSGVDTGVIGLAGTAHVNDVLAAAREGLPAGIRSEAVVAAGDGIEDAVERLDWQPDEVLLVGSSRLAQPRRLFLGSTAAKILRVVPVPMMVVPRTRPSTDSGASTGSATAGEGER